MVSYHDTIIAGAPVDMECGYSHCRLPRLFAHPPTPRWLRGGRDTWLIMTVDRCAMPQHLAMHSRLPRQWEQVRIEHLIRNPVLQDRARVTKPTTRAGGEGELAHLNLKAINCIYAHAFCLPSNHSSVRQETAALHVLFPLPQ